MPQGKQAKEKRAVARKAAKKAAHVEKHPNDKQARGPVVKRVK